VSLEFLTQHRLHNRTIAFWLEPDSPDHDPVDQSFLLGPSAHYISTYTSQYPSAFLHDPVCQQVLKRLSISLSISSNQWAHGQSPKYDLSVLASLPRLAHHLEQIRVLQLVPCKVTNADALNTLGQIFHGGSATDSFGETAQLRESGMARILFLAYTDAHPTFFADLVTHADTVALPDKALAALSLLGAIISATWPAHESSTTEEGQQAVFPNVSTESTSSPIDALLRPPARDIIVPFLLAPPRQFSNLVGGRGDTESAAYRIAMARWDVVCLFKRKSNEYVPERGNGEDVGLAAVRQAFAQRVAQGVWGQTSEVGGRVATLEL